MKNHTLTRKQAQSLGHAGLEGETVQINLHPDDPTIAKDVYYKGKRIGGYINLKE